ncbi:hypothetical protein ACFQY4_06650 [Catellatospora bangladeshensis]|uniref:hypothetical protein n=1 Tax=Catellatospora bangladeshensis TaxID=310355 RepID=UPI00361109E0
MGRSSNSPTGTEARRAQASGHMPAPPCLGEQQEEHAEHGARGQREPDHPRPGGAGALGGAQADQRDRDHRAGRADEWRRARPFAEQQAAGERHEGGGDGGDRCHDGHRAAGQPLV